ncbi:MAG: CPBP family intramembrane metalloprotease, partial [Actinobacteria bacterium]|nr:CPBP family intramembrane metalloprotease [Actinomycetota bacterium]
SALFGLWHIVPTLATARANRIVGLGRLGLVAGSVLATTAAGAVLCGLRMRTGHVLAPALLHLGVNDAGYVLAWRARRRPHQFRVSPVGRASQRRHVASDHARSLATTDVP